MRQAALVGALALWCGSMLSAEESVAPRSLEAIGTSGVLRLMVYPSLEDEFLRVDITKSPVVPASPADHYIGIDVDLLRGFADSLGVELEIRPAYAPGAVMPSFDQLIPSLLRGDGDLIASAFSVTDERARLVAFSNPYYTADMVVVVPAASAIDSEDDLRPMRGAVMAGSSQEEKLRALGVEGIVQLELLSTECFDVLRAQQADYCLLGLGSTERLAEPGFKEAFRFASVERYAVAAPPGSPLLPLLDEYIAGLQATGALQEIIDRHLR